MCGIAGYYGSVALNPKNLDAAFEKMQRRGPDAKGLYHVQNPSGHHAYLLHTRLKIIDLSDRANQPLLLERKALVYNGELYNYRELKQELLRSGRRFQSESDTEVFLWNWIQSGKRGLDACEGMWAFALYDEKEQTLTLGRDRFGEKPLYFYQDQTGVYFGSEIKYIFSLLGRKLPVNHGHLYRYLVNGYKSLYKVRETFFEGIEEVSPATLITFNALGKRSSERYWKPEGTPDPKLTFEDAVAGVKEALIQSVRLRLRADVPAAFCLSGGIDSNSLTAIAKNVLGYDVHGFTISNSDARYEEQEMVEHAVRSLGIRHTALKMSADHFIESLRTLVSQHDAPVYTISYYMHWLLMKEIAAHGYRISISGTGADELLTGYYDHHLTYLYEVREEPQLFEASRQAWMTHVQPYVRNPFLNNAQAFIENPSLREHIFLNADKFVQYLKKDWSEPFTESQYTSSLLRNRMLNEIFHEAVPVILHEDDLNAMYFSIENRSPYLDRNLFEFCQRIPSAYLIRNGRAKAVLREAMRGIVADRILDNPRKVGFNAPIADCLDRRNPKVREYLLDETAIYDHVHREKIEALLDKPELPNSESKFLFYFVNSKIFLEEMDS